MTEGKKIEPEYPECDKCKSQMCDCVKGVKPTVEINI